MNHELCTFKIPYNISYYYLYKIIWSWKNTDHCSIACRTCACDVRIIRTTWIVKKIKIVFISNKSIFCRNDWRTQSQRIRIENINDYNNEYLHEYEQKNTRKSHVIYFHVVAASRTRATFDTVSNDIIGTSFCIDMNDNFPYIILCVWSYLPMACSAHPKWDMARAGCHWHARVLSTSAAMAFGSYS